MLTENVDPIGADYADLRTQAGEWLTAHRVRLGLKEIRCAVQDVPVKKLTAWYETGDYAVDIAVWEQAYCVGIMALDKRSDSMIYAVGGRCESDSEAHARLEAFARWLVAHQSSGELTMDAASTREANAA